MPQGCGCPLEAEVINTVKAGIMAGLHNKNLSSEIWPNLSTGKAGTLRLRYRIIRDRLEGKPDRRSFSVPGQ